MKHLFPIVAATILAFSLTLQLHAQDGCGDSPENPTLILGLVSSAGVGLFQLRNRLKFRAKK
jgi:XrtJ-associated TM-motif-TM protein